MPGRFEKGMLVFAYLLPVGVYFILRFIFPLNICDDAYITLKTAVNLSDGNGLVFNAGERAYVITNPLWAAMLSAGRSLGFDIISVISFLCIVFQATFLLTAVHLGRLVSKSAMAGSLFGILMITNPIYFLSTEGGMEYAIFFTVILLSISLFIQNKYAWSLTVGSLAIWIRFDGILIYAILFLSFLYTLFKSKDPNIRKQIILTIPSFILFVGYFVFGYLYYGDMVPQSVQMKASESSVLFSGDWFYGAYNTVIQMLYAINLGALGFFYTSPGFFLIFTVFSLVAWVHFFSAKDHRSTLLVIYTLIYCVFFIGSGSTDALGYTWYYCPTFLLAYLFSAWGIYLTLKGLQKNTQALRLERSMFITVLLISLVWIPLAVDHISKNAGHLDVIKQSREKAFAIAAIWSGRNLPDDSTIAGDDLGALGFFTRPDIKVVDIYGILRTPRDKHLDRTEILKREQPEAIFLRFPRLFKGEINNGMPGMYRWFDFANLDAGIRTDIADDIVPDESEIEEISQDLDLNREY